MYNLNRLLLSHLGYPSAFFDGVVVDLRNPKTGDPENAVLCQPNGCGKTTLLSMLYSCFETRANRFIQHIQTPSHQIVDYVTDRPAIVLLELAKPGARDLLGDSPAPLLIGQMLVVRNDTLLERSFFSLTATPRYHFDNLPFKREGAAGPYLATREDYRSWVQSMKDALPGEFYETTSQSDWRKHLYTRQVDVESLERQVSFCKDEGGISALLEKDIKNEQDFLKLLFEMGLSQDRAEDLTRNIRDVQTKIRNYPAQHRLLGSYRAMAAELEAFDAKASRYRAEQAALVRNSEQLAGLGEQARQRVAQSQAQVQTAQEHLLAANAELASRQRVLAEQTGVQDALAYAVAESRLREAERALRVAREELAALTESGARLNAARLLREVRAKTQLRLQAEQALASAAEDLAPQRAELTRYANQAAGAVRHGLADRRQRLVAAQSSAAQASEEQAEASRALEELRRQRSRIEQQQARCETQIEQARVERARLIAAGHLGETESLAEALARVEADGQRLAAEKAALDEREQRLAEELETRHAEQREADQLRLTAQHDAQSTRATLSDLEARSAAILQAAERLGLPDADPDAPELRAAAEQLLAQLETVHYQLRQNREWATQDAQAIERTGLRALDPDVAAVAATLSAQGINAVPYYHYLAEVRPEADQARGIVLEDPALAQAVVVYDAAQLQVAPDYVQDLRLTRPVVLTLPVADPAGAHATRITLPARTDAAFNRAAAGRYAQSLEGDLAQLTEQQAANAAQANHVRELLQARESFEQAGGGTRILGLRETVAQQIERQQAAEQRLAMLKQQIEDLKAQQQAVRGDRERVLQALNAQGRALTALSGHQGLAEQSLAATAKLQALRAENLELDETQRALEVRRAEAQSRQTQSAQQVTEHGAALRDLERALGEFSEAEADAPAVALDPEETATAYRAQKANLAALESERGIADLRQRVEQHGQEERQLAQDYEQRFAGCNPADIEPLAALSAADLKTRLEQTEQAREAALRHEALCDANRSVAARALSALTPVPEREAQRTEWLLLTTGELEQRLHAARADCDASTAALEQAKQQVRGREADHQRAMQARKDWQQLAQRIEDVGVEPGTTGTPALSLARAEEAEQDLRALLDARKAAEQRLKQAQSEAKTQYREVLRLCKDDELSASAGELTRRLLSLEFEQALLLSDDLRAGLQLQIDTLAHELANHDRDLAFIDQELLTFFEESLRLYRKLGRQRIPDGVPRFGGLPVFKCGDIKASAQEREAAVKAFLRQLPEANYMAKNGGELARDLLLHVANSTGAALKIRLLKPQGYSGGELDYMPLNKITGSGGERVTAAFLLYLVLLRLRGDSLTEGASPSSFVVVDNPLGTASSPQLLRPVVEIAKHANIQLIVTTALLDTNALAEYGRVLRGRIASQSVKPQRSYVEYAGVSIQADVAERSA